MTGTTARGSCLCGRVSYEISGNTGIFQYCHCSRCRKFTGSVHSANLLLRPDQFRWLQGEAELGRFEQPNARHFATVFCRHCGSSMPWQTQSGKGVVVPAGTLDDDPGIVPMQNIFCASRATWYRDARDLPWYNTLPGRA